MTELTIERTLADVVTEAPGSARVLEAFGLDYCCGGRRTLGDACTAEGLDPTTVIDALADVERGPQPDWAGTTSTSTRRATCCSRRSWPWSSAGRRPRRDGPTRDRS